MSASNDILQMDFKSTPLRLQICSFFFFFVGKALKRLNAFVYVCFLELMRNMSL